MDIANVGSTIQQARRQAGLTQRQLADRAGTSQPAIARLEQGRASPTIATLERLAAAAGFTLRVSLAPKPPIDPVVELYKRDVDRTLLRENLRKSVDERLKSLAELQELGNEVQRAVRKARRKR